MEVKREKVQKNIDILIINLINVINTTTTDKTIKHKDYNDKILAIIKKNLCFYEKNFKYFTKKSDIKKEIGHLEFKSEDSNILITNLFYENSYYQKRDSDKTRSNLRNIIKNNTKFNNIIIINEADTVTYESSKLFFKLKKEKLHKNIIFISFQPPITDFPMEFVNFLHGIYILNSIHFFSCFTLKNYSNIFICNGEYFHKTINAQYVSSIGYNCFSSKNQRRIPNIRNLCFDGLIAYIFFN